MLTQMVEVGDMVEDVNGEVSTITHIEGNLAITDQWLPEFGEFNMFIARFLMTGPVVGYEFNMNFTLVQSNGTTQRLTCGGSNKG